MSPVPLRGPLALIVMFRSSPIDEGFKEDSLSRVEYFSGQAGYVVQRKTLIHPPNSLQKDVETKNSKPSLFFMI